MIHLQKGNNQYMKGNVMWIPNEGLSGYSIKGFCSVSHQASSLVISLFTVTLLSSLLELHITDPVIPFQSFYHVQTPNPCF